MKQVQHQQGMIPISHDGGGDTIVEFENLLEDREGVQTFRKYLQRSHNEQCIDFYFACLGFKKTSTTTTSTCTDNQKTHHLAKTIFRTYLPNSRQKLISTETRSKLKSEISGNSVNPNSFNDSFVEIIDVLKKRYYPEFIHSDYFIQYTREVANAENEDPATAKAEDDESRLQADKLKDPQQKTRRPCPEAMLANANPAQFAELVSNKLKAVFDADRLGSGSSGSDKKTLSETKLRNRQYQSTDELLKNLFGDCKIKEDKQEVEADANMVLDQHCQYLGMKKSLTKPDITESLMQNRSPRPSCKQRKMDQLKLYQNCHACSSSKRQPSRNQNRAKLSTQIPRSLCNSDSGISCFTLKPDDGDSSLVSNEALDINSRISVEQQLQISSSNQQLHLQNICNHHQAHQQHQHPQDLPAHQHHQSHRRRQSIHCQSCPGGRQITSQSDSEMRQFSVSGSLDVNQNKLSYCPGDIQSNRNLSHTLNSCSLSIAGGSGDDIMCHHYQRYNPHISSGDTHHQSEMNHPPHHLTQKHIPCLGSNPSHPNYLQQPLTSHQSSTAQCHHCQSQLFVPTIVSSCSSYCSSCMSSCGASSSQFCSSSCSSQCQRTKTAARVAHAQGSSSSCVTSCFSDGSSSTNPLPPLPDTAASDISSFHSHDISIYSCRVCQPVVPPSDRIKLWMESNFGGNENTESCATPSLQNSAAAFIDHSHEDTQPIRSKSAYTLRPLQPFAQDASMPLPPLPDTRSQLEEATRRLRNFQNNYDGTTASSYNNNQKFKRNCMTPGLPSGVSTSIDGVSTSTTSQPPISSGDGSAVSPSTECEQTRIEFYFADEPVCSYVNIIGGDVTLRRFKQLINRTGNFRFYFKTRSNEFTENGTVNYEVINDGDLLPFWSKHTIMARIEKQQLSPPVLNSKLP